MKYIVLIVVLVLALLATPATTHQAPPCIGFGLAVESPMAVAINTDCLDLKYAKATLESAADIWHRGDRRGNVGYNRAV